ARWGREARSGSPLVQKPSLHRGKPGGGGNRAARCFLCRSLRSTETSSVGAGGPFRFASGAEALAPPGQARWGRRAAAEPPLWWTSPRSTGASPAGARRGGVLLVQKPSLLRGESGGGGLSINDKR